MKKIEFSWAAAAILTTTIPFLPLSECQAIPDSDPKLAKPDEVAQLQSTPSSAPAPAAPAESRAHYGRYLVVSSPTPGVTVTFINGTSDSNPPSQKITFPANSHLQLDCHFPDHFLPLPPIPAPYTHSKLVYHWTRDWAGTVGRSEVDRRTLSFNQNNVNCNAWAIFQAFPANGTLLLVANGATAWWWRCKAERRLFHNESETGDGHLFATYYSLSVDYFQAPEPPSLQFILPTSIPVTHEPSFEADGLYSELRHAVQEPVVAICRVLNATYNDDGSSNFKADITRPDGSLVYVDSRHSRMIRQAADLVLLYLAPQNPRNDWGTFTCRYGNDSFTLLSITKTMKLFDHIPVLLTSEQTRRLLPLVTPTSALFNLAAFPRKPRCAQGQDYVRFKVKLEVQLNSSEEQNVTSTSRLIHDLPYPQVMNFSVTSLRPQTTYQAEVTGFRESYYDHEQRVATFAFTTPSEREAFELEVQKWQQLQKETKKE